MDGQLFLGPPKTAESTRTIALPPFLVALLGQHLHSHRHPHVFVTADGAFLRRSNVSRRAMRPAADGTTHRPRPAVAVAPVAPGLTLHGFRHSHKTWPFANRHPVTSFVLPRGPQAPNASVLIRTTRGKARSNAAASIT